MAGETATAAIGTHPTGMPILFWPNHPKYGIENEKHLTGEARLQVPAWIRQC